MKKIYVFRYLPGEPSVVAVANLSPKDSVVSLESFRVLPSAMIVQASGLNSKLQKGWLTDRNCFSAK